MPRKGHIAKREVAPDPVYASTLVTKFCELHDCGGGKKSTAQGIFYQAMKNLEEKGRRRRRAQACSRRPSRTASRCSK